jgi:uncharacterized protein YlaI
MLKFYCEVCGELKPVEIKKIEKDDLNEKPWGDILCSDCHFVIATVSADKEGYLIFKEV